MLQACFSIISNEGALCKRERTFVAISARTAPEVVIWPSLINPVMDCVRDERIIRQSNRSPPHCHAQSEMGTVSDGMVGRTKCIAEYDFDRRNVRVHRGGLGAGADFC